MAWPEVIVPIMVPFVRLLYCLGELGTGTEPLLSRNTNTVMSPSALLSPQLTDPTEPVKPHLNVTDDPTMPYTLVLSYFNDVNWNATFNAKIHIYVIEGSTHL